MIKLQEIVGLPTLQYHLENKLTLSECIYRYSSDSFVQLFAEARQALRDGKIELNEQDEKLLRETDIGEYGIFEGKKVPLDLPMVDEELDEAEYKGKDVALNKPKRGGPKKFFVYVKNPKTGNVKKVNFGDSGNLTVKIKEPGARAAFAARHQCAKKKVKTSPNIGLFWEAGYKKNIDYSNIIQERAIICICYKWEDDKEVYALQWDAKQNDKRMLEQFIEVANVANEMVGHNGDKFDLAWIRTRCLFHKIEMFPKYTTIDTLKVARQKFRFNSNRLNYIADFLGIGQKIKTEYSLWKNILLVYLIHMLLENCQFL